MEKALFNYDKISVYNKKLGRFSLAEGDLRIATFPDEYTNFSEELCQMHTSDFYFIAWVEQGDFEYYVDLQKINPKGKSLLLSSPGGFRNLKSVQTIHGISINFTENFFHYMPDEWASYLKHCIIKRVPYLEIKSEESEIRIKQRINQVKEQVERQRDNLPEQIGAYSSLAMLLCEIAEISEFKELESCLEEGSTVSKGIYLLFMEKLEEGYKKHHSVQFYAEELQVSMSALANYCKQNAGLKPLEMINNRILLEAKRLLLFTQMRGNEIALTLGFREQAHFVHFFRRLTGVTPTVFQKQAPTHISTDMINNQLYGKR